MCVNKIIIGIILGISAISSIASEIRVEGAVADFSRNEIKVPGDNGTQFDTTKDGWKQTNAAAYRIYISHEINEDSSIRLLYAPLQTTFNGSFGQESNFNGEKFNAGSAKVNYKFNSYRVSYIKRLYQNQNIKLNYGFVGKIRDAEIEIVQENKQSVRKDLGFIPLLHFDLKYKFYDELQVYFDLDGLVAPQGRALDGGVFLQRELNKYGVFIGYRFLDGGVNNHKVKTFSFINYYTAGLTLKF